MQSAPSKQNSSITPRERLLQFLTCCRVNFRSIICAAALFAVICELGGIWFEVHQMRREQVKNAAYALPVETRQRLHGTGRGKKLESTSFVQGEVGIDGEVKVEDPVEVEVEP